MRRNALQDASQSSFNLLCPAHLSVNKDTPHYKLMVLLEQELPEASRRDKIDELGKNSCQLADHFSHVTHSSLAADRFCVNHGSNKNSRKRLYKTLFLIPHGRLDLLPYWSRFASIMDRVYSDCTLVTELEQQMHGQARFKKNQNLDSRLRTVRYISELTKFRTAPPIVALRGIKRCLEDFSGYNIDVACCFLENCGRYLYRTKHTHKKLSDLMETMMRIKKARVSSSTRTCHCTPFLWQYFLTEFPPTSFYILNNLCGNQTSTES